MNMMIRAIEFATLKHMGQVRKFSNEPYVTHPIIVSQICAQFTNDLKTLIAGVLHDTIEDTNTTKEELSDIFGNDISEMVFYSSEISKKSDGTRAVRKQMDCDHYCKGNIGSKVIKIADAIHNCWGIYQQGGSFVKVYVNEKITMVEAIINSESDSELVQSIGNECLEMLYSWKNTGIMKSNILT